MNDDLHSSINTARAVNCSWGKTRQLTKNRLSGGNVAEKVAIRCNAVASCLYIITG